MIQRVTSQLLALTMVVGLLIATDASAQDKKSSKIEITQNGETVKIEVKDGKTYVDGELIPEDADISDYLPEGFDSDVVVMGDGDLHMFRRGDGVFGFRGRDGENGRSVWFSDGDGENELHFESAKGLVEKLGDLQTHSFELAQMPEFDGLRNFASGNFFVSGSPEISKNERKARELAREIKSASGSDRTRMESDLDELLDEIFEAKMELREERIAKQRESLEEQETSLRDRRARKSDIIERRKSELTGSGDRYRW